MIVSIGCLDGKTYVSDEIPNEEIQKDLWSHDGRIGSGIWADRVINTVEEYAEVVKDLAQHDTSFATKSFLMTIGGKDFQFNAHTIVWVSVDV
jgi:hypothetical protein